MTFSNLLYKYDMKRDIKESRNLIEILKSFRHISKNCLSCIDQANSKLKLNNFEDSQKPLILDLARSSQANLERNCNNQMQSHKMFKKKMLK